MKTLKKIKYKNKFLFIDDNATMQDGDIIVDSEFGPFIRLEFGKWQPKAEYDEEIRQLSHAGCQNYPNCDEEGCGGGK